jgi:hypothetical protein
MLALMIALVSCGGSTAEKGKEKAKDFKLEVKDTYAPGEEAAQQVLLAYKTKDVELLKQYASWAMSMALDEDAMDRPDFEKQLKSWNGAINEVRYASDDINFQHIYYAYAHYCDDKEDSDKIYVVVIQSTDKEKWVITMNPLRKMTKATFAEKSATIPE